MMAEAMQELYGEEYFGYLQNRGSIRKLVRKIYLRDIRNRCEGKTIDFGCGVGELLKILPAGSVGYEVNPMAVAYCRRSGLDVSLYDPEEDNYEFRFISPGRFTTFTMNHVLEHIPDSASSIKKIFESCARLGIARSVFTVPGIKGYAADKTHRTFIDKKYLSASGILEDEHYQLVEDKYFPFNWGAVGKYFRHNELRLVFDRRLQRQQ